MTLYDAAMVGLVVLGLIWGAMRGITWQLASMASLALGYLVGFPLSGPLADRFPGEPAVARTLALLASYAGVSAAVFFVAWMVRATLRRLQFEAYDRHLGMILGGAEAAFLGLVGTLFLTSLVPQCRTPIFASPTGRLVGRVLGAVEPALPGEIRAELAPFWAGAGLAPEPGQGPEAEPPPAIASRRDRGGAANDDPRVERTGTEAAGPGLDPTGLRDDPDLERR